jgi:hypothetical protein
MTLYTAPSGSDVFAAGTIEWAWGLEQDSWVNPGTYPNPGAQQMTLNILTRLARCAGPQSNMVSWWAGEGNGEDELGRNPGTFPQGVSFTNGVAGQGFWFNGTNQYLAVTNAVTSSMVSTQFSVDTWIMPAPMPPNSGVIFAAADANGSPWFNLTAQVDGSLQLALVTTNSSGLHQLTYASGVPVLSPGELQHVAVTTDSGSGQTLAFVDGAPAVLTLNLGSQPTGSCVFPGASRFYIGGLPPNTSSNYFQGLIDEVGAYARVISPNEVMAIYNARSGGRCGDEARVTFSRVGPTNRLSWPLGALGFALQSTSNFSIPWVTVTNTSVINGNQVVFDVASSSGLRFYRLARTGR